MSAVEFWGALLVIAVGVVILTIAGVAWATRMPPVADEPTEHGDGEE